VKDAQGNPVNDSAKGVTFTSSLGATITPTNTPNSINLGVCSATYLAPAVATTTAANKVDQITASYQGAVAWVSIYVYAP
jgi:hypothetical protein